MNQLFVLQRTRRVYKFNAVFDRQIFIPVVNGYKTITPRLVRTGISNFFSNLRELPNFVNAVLQLKLEKATHRVDFLTISPVRIAFDLEGGEALAYLGLYAIDTRYRIAFRYHETGSPFEYELV